MKKLIYVGFADKELDREVSWIDSFKKLNCDVKFFDSLYSQQNYSIFSQLKFFENLQNKFLHRLNIGSENSKMQKDLINFVKDYKPDWVHFRLPVQFDKKTILAIKAEGALVTSYFNDNPFSKNALLGAFNKFKKAIPAYDIHFVFRKKNIDDFYKNGAKQVFHCPPTYDKKRHFFREGDIPIQNFTYDAAFIGHWESDWRAECIDYLIKKNHNVAVRGGMWNENNKLESIKKTGTISHAFGEEYNKIYRNSIAGLCFYSKINEDMWTRRALEIVAAGGLLVSERTPEAVNYFKDREEAMFFSTKEELNEVVFILKNNLDKREQIRQNGLNRLLKNKDDILDRAKFVYDLADKTLKKQIIFNEKKIKNYSNKNKLLYVSYLFFSPDRDYNWINSFGQSNNIEIKLFPTSILNFDQRNTLYKKFIHRFNIGSENSKMQKDLINFVKDFKPDWVHFRLPIQFDKKTILAIKAEGALVTSYFNDNPFSKNALLGAFNKFKKAIPAYDIHFVYRESNIKNFYKNGAKQVFHCPPTYDKKRHFFREGDIPIKNFTYDAAFIGHCEKDWRAECIDYLIKKNHNVAVRGGMWNETNKFETIKRLGNITPAFGEEYNKIYRNSIAGLCFYSKINEDMWTERALEIVAAGGLLVSERTQEAVNYFKDREEAMFFSTKEELSKILTFLKNNLDKREQIRQNGLNRLLKNKDDILDRAKFVEKISLTN